jgi:hypothetical protein
MLELPIMWFSKAKSGYFSMDKNKVIFLIPNKYAIYNGYGCLDDDENERRDEEKQKSRLKKIEEFMRTILLQNKQDDCHYSENSTIESKLVDYINQLIEIQNNISKHPQHSIALKCEEIFIQIMQNKELSKAIKLISKLRGIYIDSAIQYAILDFNRSSKNNEEIICFLIRLRNLLLEIFEFYIKTLPDNSQNKHLTSTKPNSTNPYKQEKEIIAGSIKIDLEQRCVYKESELIKITCGTKEYKLILELAQRPNTYIDIKEIFPKIYEGVQYSEQFKRDFDTLNTLVATVREKLGMKNTEKPFISISPRNQSVILKTE